MPATVPMPVLSFSVMEWTGKRIKALRKRRHLTQSEMADWLGYDRYQSVSDLETERRQPSGAVVRLLEILDRHGMLDADEGEAGDGDGS